MEKWNAKIARYLNVYRLHIWRERTEELSCLYGWQRTEPLRIWRGLHPIIIIKFGREVRSKLPQLKRETVGVPGEEVLKWDWWSKLKGKAYADLRSGATSKSKRIGDMVLWKAAKTNKLSTNFNPDPFKVVHKTGSEVTFKNKAGVELKTMHLWRSTMSTTMYPMATETKWYRQILQYRRMSQGQAKVQRQQMHQCQVKFQGRLKYLNTLEYKLGISKRKASGAERPVWRSTRTVRLPVRYKVIQYKHFELNVLNCFFFFFILCLA